MKTCRICGEKDQEKLHKRRGGVDTICKKCYSDYMKNYHKEYYKKNIIKFKEYKQTIKAKESNRKYNKSEKGKISARRILLRNTYGITLEDYNSLLLAQNGRCAVCGIESSEAPKSILYVDHNHETGKIRGLLCSNCNTSLGLLKENKITIENLLIYLEKYEEDTSNKCIQ